MNSLRFRIFLLLIIVPSICQPKFALVFSDKIEKFIVKLADKDSEREKGLMNLRELKHYNGMLFIYNEPRIVRMWMKNTLIPLKFIFVDENDLIIGIHVIW